MITKALLNGSSLSCLGSSTVPQPKVTGMPSISSPSSSSSSFCHSQPIVTVLFPTFGFVGQNKFKSNFAMQSFFTVLRFPWSSLYIVNSILFTVERFGPCGLNHANHFQSRCGDRGQQRRVSSDNGMAVFALLAHCQGFVSGQSFYH